MSAHQVTAKLVDLLSQAPMTTTTYVRAGVREIDAAFGDGYAATHPELLAVFVQTCALDVLTSGLLVAAQGLRETLTTALSDVADRITDVGQSVDRLADAVRER